MSARPLPRGPVSALLLERLGRDVATIPAQPVKAPANPLADEDLQFALYLCYELHYRGLPGANAEWEWEPTLLRLRRQLERQFEGALFDAIGLPGADRVDAREIDVALRAIAEADDGPAISTFIERQATIGHVREFLVHRSAYQLKEADPHSWAIPRLHAGPKAALVEIQSDEYGGGDASRIHASLYARSMAAVGLSPAYGAYLDRIPGYTLATVNLMSMLGLHRRWRGAICGHLALFEMTSSLPNRRYANGLRRLGLGEDATDFFDEHVVADAVHENIAAVDLAGGLARQDPSLGPDVLWGARALVELDARWARNVVTAWESGDCSLLAPLRHRAAAAA